MDRSYKITSARHMMTFRNFIAIIKKEGCSNFIVIIKKEGYNNFIVIINK